MTQIVGHRWERDDALLQYRCVPLPFGGVESGQWCVGCGATVTDLELHRADYPYKEVWLDILARDKGFPPIQYDTLQYYEWLALKQGVA